MNNERGLRRGWRRPVGVDVVAPLLDIPLAGEKLVALVVQLLGELGVELCLKSGVLRDIDEIVLLIGVGVVVEEEPWAVQIADVGVAVGAEAAVIGKKDASRGEVVVAFVTAREGQEIKAAPSPGAAPPRR